MGHIRLIIEDASSDYIIEGWMLDGGARLEQNANGSSKIVLHCVGPFSIQPLDREGVTDRLITRLHQHYPEVAL